MKPPSDFMVPKHRKFLAYIHDSIVHVQCKDVYFPDLESLPASKTLLHFGDSTDKKFYTRECVLLQVIQNKDVLQKVERRWQIEDSVTVLVHLKFKSKFYSSKNFSNQYRFVDVGNRPVRISVPDRVSNLTDLGDIRRFSNMETDHCYVFEIQYARGEVEYTKLLADTTESKRMGQPSWLQELSAL